MKQGEAFEIFVRDILWYIGFSNVASDKIYVFDGSAGQMIQGLGEAHNADVLMEPPVQIPFYIPSRLLVECKNYKNAVGLNIVRNLLGVREDINHFNVVDAQTLIARQKQRRGIAADCYYRHWYQVAVASTSGYTRQAEEFAAAHRMSLIDFCEYPFWSEIKKIIESLNDADTMICHLHEKINEIGKRMALLMTDFGQMIFLYHCEDEDIDFSEKIHLTAVQDKEGLWELYSGDKTYLFQSSKLTMKNWINSCINELSLKNQEILNLVVYFRHNEKPDIKMISVYREEFEKLSQILNAM